MSKRNDVLWDIARWCAVREIPQEETVSLIHGVLDISGLSNYDTDNPNEEIFEIQEIERSVKNVYAQILGYEYND